MLSTIALLAYLAGPVTAGLIPRQSPATVTSISISTVFAYAPPSTTTIFAYAPYLNTTTPATTSTPAPSSGFLSLKREAPTPLNPLLSWLVAPIQASQSAAHLSAGLNPINGLPAAPPARPTPKPSSHAPIPVNSPLSQHPPLLPSAPKNPAPPKPTANFPQGPHPAPRPLPPLATASGKPPAPSTTKPAPPAGSSIAPYGWSNTSQAPKPSSSKSNPYPYPNPDHTTKTKEPKQTPSCPYPLPGGC